MKPLALLAAAMLLSAPSTPPEAAAPFDFVEQPYTIDGDAMVRLICRTAKGDMRVGSGFWLNKARLVTALHVVADRQCWANGIPAKIEQAVPGFDYAVMRSFNAGGVSVAFSCRPIAANDVMLAVGYPGVGTGKTLKVLIVQSTGERSTAKGYESLTMFLGGRADIGGASGGMIVDTSGAVRGIILAETHFTPRSAGPSMLLGLPLADTPLCKDKP